MTGRRATGRGWLLCALACLAPPTATAAPPALPSDDAVREELQSFLRLQRGAPGVVVGLVDRRGGRVVVSGSTGREGAWGVVSPDDRSSRRAARRAPDAPLASDVTTGLDDASTPLHHRPS